ncbi:lytic murein transglycosylase [Micromonospora sp. NPDC000089]|uniref:lytic murein transglycosylase n=1 Tax=unclassified Micromonospora TaxID=2617518 RepID=UPI0036BD7FC1
MASGEDRSTVRPLRPATPLGGPLGSSGAAPEPGGTTAPAAIPRPRRPVPPADTPTAVPAGGTAGPTGAGDEVSASTVPAQPRERDDDTATAAPEDRAAPLAPTAGDTAKAEPDDTAKTEPDGDPARVEPDGGAEAGGSTPPTTGAAGRRRRVPFAHAVRLPPPRRAVVGAARATRAWSRRPSGRVTVPALFLFLLIATTAAAGALVVPAAVRTADTAAPEAAASAGLGVPSGQPTAAPAVPGAPVVPGATALPSLPAGTALPGGALPTGSAAGGTPGPARPAAALAGWARTTGAKVGIPPVAMQAYGYAELVLAQTNRSCQLSWTTLAAIGYVESRHGTANGARLNADARAEPEIIGDPLDGQGGRSLIRDTDRGLFDRDTVYDRAIGPMQFIPTTWQQIGADADNDGRKDPHDLDDAALAAARYLCAGGRNMTIPGDWWGAILSYNDVRRYAQDVFDTANRYGQASRT